MAQDGKMTLTDKGQTKSFPLPNEGQIVLPLYTNQTTPPFQRGHQNNLKPPNINPTVHTFYHSLTVL